MKTGSKNPWTAESVQSFRGHAGIHGPPIWSEFLKGDERIHGPPIRSKFLKRKQGTTDRRISPNFENRIQESTNRRICPNLLTSTSRLDYVDAQNFFKNYFVHTFLFIFIYSLYNIGLVSILHLCASFTWSRFQNFFLRKLQ